MKTFNNKSIHRILATRLATAGIIISLVLGVAVFLVERGKIGEVVLDSALQGAVYFNDQAGYLLDQPGLPDHEGIQRELDIFVSRSLKRRKSPFARVGHIVFVNLFGLDRSDVAKYIDRSYANIKEVETYKHASKLPLPHNNMDRYEINMIKGVPYIMFCVPLTNSIGVVVAHAEGVFVVSSEAVAYIKLRALKTALIIIAIVLVTTWCVS